MSFCFLCESLLCNIGYELIFPVEYDAKHIFWHVTQKRTCFRRLYSCYLFTSNKKTYFFLDLSLPRRSL
ncbi:hypothetical protein L2E82_31856 [Cichorium intybus]|uniref:Uncharacterized protein n=1 Tax=Cichorium intybus TaxID=13427 RepID=A0ACB9BES7_CICIN|nr:hypothetical protein L2E82_31856 [Cichorium intybus]